MILDTSYLLPFSQIGIDTDLIKAILENQIAIQISDLTINSISLFELQAKAAKLEVPISSTIEAMGAITTIFKMEPFYDPKIVALSYDLLKLIPDYIDCIILATAIKLNEDLITEDSKIKAETKFIKEKYGINVFTYSDLINKTY